MFCCLHVLYWRDRFLPVEAFRLKRPSSDTTQPPVSDSDRLHVTVHEWSEVALKSHACSAWKPHPSHKALRKQSFEVRRWLDGSVVWLWKHQSSPLMAYRISLYTPDTETLTVCATTETRGRGHPEEFSIIREMWVCEAVYFSLCLNSFRHDLGCVRAARWLQDSFKMLREAHNALNLLGTREVSHNCPVMSELNTKLWTVFSTVTTLDLGLSVQSLRFLPVCWVPSGSSSFPHRPSGFRLTGDVNGP